MTRVRTAFQIVVIPKDFRMGRIVINTDYTDSTDLCSLMIINLCSFVGKTP